MNICPVCKTNQYLEIWMTSDDTYYKHCDNCGLDSLIYNTEEEARNSEEYQLDKCLREALEDLKVNDSIRMAKELEKRVNKLKILISARNVGKCYRRGDTYAKILASSEYQIDPSYHHYFSPETYPCLVFNADTIDQRNEEIMGYSYEYIVPNAWKEITLEEFKNALNKLINDLLL